MRGRTLVVGTVSRAAALILAIGLAPSQATGQANDGATVGVARPEAHGLSTTVPSAMVQLAREGQAQHARYHALGYLPPPVYSSPSGPNGSADPFNLYNFHPWIGIDLASDGARGMSTTGDS